MKGFLYHWLPIFFGCHCRADRSFFWKGEQFPICARCTGELIGMLAFFSCCFWYIPSFRICLILMLPLIVDGFTQKLTAYESTNLRRVLTGFLFGYGFAALLVKPLIQGFLMGYHWGTLL